MLIYNLECYEYNSLINLKSLDLSNLFSSHISNNHNKWLTKLNNQSIIIQTP